MSPTAVAEVRQVTYPQVVLILGLSAILMTGIIILSINGLDVAAIFSAVAIVALTVMGALGINLKHSVDQVKDLSNGRLDAMTKDNKELHQKLQDLAMRLPSSDPSK
jgi:hypothetical protein